MRRTALWLGMPLLAVALAAPAPAAALVDHPPPPQPMSENGVSYVSGGVGHAEREMLGAMSERDYNLKLEFARRDGAYLADVSVSIRDARSGRTVLDTVSRGPWFFAKLPPGSYRVEVQGEGRSFRRDIEVGRADRAVVAFTEWSGTVQSASGR